jgi:hypothetical protein
MKLHIQKYAYDGLENMETPNRALEVTQGSSNDTNLGHLVTLKFKKTHGEKLGIFKAN